ncbi:LuxR C-terminal-related transcriptional regulator [Agromyces bauzanensis]
MTATTRSASSGSTGWTVAIISQRRLLREALSAALRDGGAVTLGSYESAQAAVLRHNAGTPDVVVVDLEPSGESTTRDLLQLLDLYRGRTIIGLASSETAHAEAEFHGAALRWCQDKWRSIHPAGGLQELRSLVDALLEYGDQAGQPVLTHRQRQVLRLAATGMSNSEIGRALVISVGTVKRHMHESLHRLGATSRIRAIAKAYELGIVS